MRKEEKNAIVSTIVSTVNKYEHFYLTDITALNAASTTALRRECANEEIKLMVVKNTLLQKALETFDVDFTELNSALKGNTAVMFSNSANAPAKLIAKFGKATGIPALKAAYVQESFYVGANNLKALENIKSKNELLGDIIGMLQSPIKNVVSSLQSGGNTIHGVLETLANR